ncbi:MAG: hypothetical protein ACE5EX_00975 [Phycisphaerae bacterium]
MLIPFLSIAGNTFVETLRQPVYGVLMVVTILLLILNIFVAGFTLEDDNKLLMDLGLSTILLGGLFLAAFSATGVLTREIENKTVLTIISKPVSRPVFVTGKYLGLMGAQFVAFYIALLVFVLCMHHRVLQYSTDPFDWPAIILGGGSLVLAILLAAAANFFYGKEFSSTAVSLVVPMLTVGTVLTALFDREWGPAPFAKTFAGGQLLVAAFLILLAIMIVAAVALAASTRLGQVMTLMTCVMVLIAGFLSDWVLGQYRDESALAAVLYRVVPNINFFWVVDAITAGIIIPGRYILQVTAYALLFVVAVLTLGVALFQRREVG